MTRLGDFERFGDLVFFYTGDLDRFGDFIFYCTGEVAHFGDFGFTGVFLRFGDGTRFGDLFL